MNTMVSAWGPLVMKVFEPDSTYSSPSRRAVAFIDPKASEPEPGSVMAHAHLVEQRQNPTPTEPSAQSSPWRCGGGGEPHRHAHGGDHAGTHPAQLDERHGRVTPRQPCTGPAVVAAPRRRCWQPFPLDHAVESITCHLVHAEGGEQAPQQVVGREVAELQLVTPGLDLGLDVWHQAVRIICCSSFHSNIETYPRGGRGTPIGSPWVASGACWVGVRLAVGIGRYAVPTPRPNGTLPRSDACFDLAPGQRGPIHDDTSQCHALRPSTTRTRCRRSGD